MEESRERDVRPAQHPALPLLLSDCHGDPACQRGGALGAQAYLLQMSSWGRQVHTGRELSTPMHPKEKLFRASLLMLLSPTADLVGFLQEEHLDGPCVFQHKCK